MPTTVISAMAANDDDADDVAAMADAAKQRPTALGRRGDDAAEDDDRDAVADADLGDQLTHPDQHIVPAVMDSRIASDRHERARVEEAEAFEQLDAVRTCCA